jgi:hypothetical protein
MRWDREIRRGSIKSLFLTVVLTYNREQSNRHRH